MNPTSDQSLGPARVDEPVDPAAEEAWRLEIRSRTAAYEQGKSTLYDADEVIAEATRLTQ